MPSLPLLLMKLDPRILLRKLLQLRLLSPYSLSLLSFRSILAYAPLVQNETFKLKIRGL